MNDFLHKYSHIIQGVLLALGTLATYLGYESKVAIVITILTGMGLSWLVPSPLSSRPPSDKEGEGNMANPFRKPPASPYGLWLLAAIVGCSVGGSVQGQTPASAVKPKTQTTSLFAWRDQMIAMHQQHHDRLLALEAAARQPAPAPQNNGPQMHYHYWNGGPVPTPAPSPIPQSQQPIVIQHPAPIILSPPQQVLPAPAPPQQILPGPAPPQQVLPGPAAPQQVLPNPAPPQQVLPKQDVPQQKLPGPGNPQEAIPAPSPAPPDNGGQTLPGPTKPKDTMPPATTLAPKGIQRYSKTNVKLALAKPIK